LFVIALWNEVTLILHLLFTEIFPEGILKHPKVSKLYKHPLTHCQVMTLTYFNVRQHSSEINKCSGKQIKKKRCLQQFIHINILIMLSVSFWYSIIFILGQLCSLIQYCLCNIMKSRSDDLVWRFP